MYRRRKDLFTLDDVEFKKRYRFNKETVRRITDLVRNEIMRDPKEFAVSSVSDSDSDAVRNEVSTERVFPPDCGEMI